MEEIKQTTETYSQKAIRFCNNRKGSGVTHFFEDWAVEFSETQAAILKQDQRVLEIPLSEWDGLTKLINKVTTPIN